MAGFPNKKFLAPSHFAKPDENIAAKTTTDSAKPVLLPPSNYAKVATSNLPKKASENVQRSADNTKSAYCPKVFGQDDEKENKEYTNRVKFLDSELQKAKRKICELEQEKVILEDNLQDRQALSEVVCQLKKDLKKSKEKLSAKDKGVSDKVKENLDVIKYLRSDLKQAEMKYGSLKQNYSKLVEELRLSDETNSYLKRKIEAKDLEFECMVRAKEDEVHGAVMRLKEMSVERDLKNNLLIQLEEKYKKLDGSKRQADDEHERVLKDKMTIKEEYDNLKVIKDRIEGDFIRVEEERQKILRDMERIKEDINRTDCNRVRLEEENCRIQQDKVRVEEEKCKIIKDNEKSQEKMKRMERQFLDEQERCLKLQNEMQEKDLMISELNSCVETKQEELNRVKLECKNKTEEIEKKFELKVSQLEDDMHSKDRDFHKENQMCQEALLKKDEDISALSKSVEQLRSYIGEVRPSQETEKLSETNQQLTKNIQILTDENNTLHSTVKLLNVRLSAILEIVSIQEAEMTRDGGVTVLNGSNEGLLRTWREKVFALMVQLQSQKIAESETKRKEDVKLKSFNTKLQEVERSNSILSHKLADQEAATELEINKRAKLEQETEKLKAENCALKKQEKHWSTQFEALHKFTMNVEKAFLQSLCNFNKCVSKLTSFDQRMKFASSRIQFISEFLAHRDSQQKTRSFDVEEGKAVEGSTDESSREHEEYLKSEVQRLLKERAVLLNENKGHKQTLQEKTSSLQEQYERVIGEKNAQIEKLEVSESEKRERLHSLQDQLESKCQELEEASETIEELKLSMSKEQTTMEKAHRETMEKERLKNAEDMAIMESQLNDIRREHAKAVAAVKNSERRVNREKQQAANMVANIEREYCDKLARCEKQLKSVEKERNLLMVRIREDRSTVVRSQPITGACSFAKEKHVSKPLEKSLPKQTLGKSRTQENIVDNEETESINPIDAEEALTALKEIKVLSQQIVKLHDKQNTVSASESEM